MPTNLWKFLFVHRLSSDFWRFWSGQTISSLGNAITLFALPLLIYKLTGSAVNLALVTAASYLPYPLFGLIIGAWTDRVNRRRLMIFTDLIRTIIIASIPLLAVLNRLPVWWIYAVAFLGTTLAISFDSAESAAIPSLVKRADLVQANGRIQVGYSAAEVVGPLLAGLLVAFIPLQMILFIDALSFLISAASLALIQTNFNTDIKRIQTKIHHDVVEGLRYVLRHPVLRTLAILMALVNLVESTIGAQLVLFAKQHLQASDTQVGLLFSVGGCGIIVLSLAAGSIRKRLSFSSVALGALIVRGLLLLAMALAPSYWMVLPLWALFEGLNMLSTINSISMRQAMVPNHMLGRVQSIVRVMSWSVIPLGTLVGGVVIEQTHNVTLIYGAIGVLLMLLAFAFALTPLAHAARYLPPEEVV